MQYDEPGPSNTQRSPSLISLPPSPTLVQVRSRPVPTTQGPTSSQATIVASQHQPRTRAVQPHANPLQNPSNTAAVAKKQSAPSQTAGGSGAARKTAPKRAPNPALASASVPAPAQEEQPPPFRITRARSRSLEPIAMVKEKDKGKGKGKGKEKKRTPILQPVFEDQAIVKVEAHIPPPPLSETGPTRETYEEEEAVDQLLSEAVMEPEDDAQVRKAFEDFLQAGDEGADAEEDDESEEEDELEKLLKARDTKSQATARSKPSASGTSRPAANGSPTASRFTYSPLINISTPVPSRRTRSTHVAAVSLRERTFPSPGSRASVVREKKERELKRAPYEPPAGTRAARQRQEHKL